MMIKTPEDFKSDRLNDEVALFMNCTLKETLALVGISLVCSGFLSIPPSLIFWGKLTLSLAVMLIVMVPVFFVLLIRLSRLKRGKPAGYYVQFLKIQLSRWGILKSPYVRRSGAWSLGRISKGVSR